MRFLIFFLLAFSAFGAAPQRIVSTAPSFTETLFALGAGPQVVAVSTYCHYPAEVNQLPRIGSYLKPNVEAIVRLKPDLLIVHAEQKQTLQQFAALGIRVLPVRNNSLEEVFLSIGEMAKALEIPERGVRLEKSIKTRLAAIEQAAKARPQKSLLFVVGRTPGTLDGMVAVGKGSFLNELMRIAGGRNVLSDSPVTYPKISLESVIRLHPDIIVDMGDMAETTGVSEDHKRAVVKLWTDRFGARPVYAVASDIFVVPGPRMAEAAEAFARMLQGVER
ncbi:ABC transporter substrate-binding protein [Bryobacter aggregatus]|uniref:ABC transporter substrate-binding protein n=1 Tax=Bryobacter aggregatus TaxID=360054 RepID=UPI0004E11D0C|nr:ABC transporter substrate-binding protein [Bryobacter aggregatus]